MTPQAAATPVIVVPCIPFSIIGFDDNDGYQATFEEINHSRYDYVRFCRTTTVLDPELGTKFGAIVTYTSSILFPMVRGMTKKLALDATNRILFRLLIGGIHFNAPMPDDIGFGLLYHTGYFRCTGGASGDAYGFIHALQSRTTGQDRNPLLHRPRFFTKNDIQHRYWHGRHLTTEMSDCNYNLLMNSVTRFLSHDYESSLVFSWSFIEQLIEKIWQRDIISFGDDVYKRRSFLRSRSWNSASKIELLYQRGIIDGLIYGDLSLARDERNKLIHDGRRPDFRACKKSLAGCMEPLVSHLYETARLEGNKNRGWFD